jgi:hypothetical protein
LREEAELSEASVRGERAKQILNDKLVKGALTSMRESVYHNISTSHFKAVDEREDLYKMLQAITHFENEFKRHISGGKKARSMLDKLFNKGE